MKITVIVETDESNLGDRATVSSTRNVAVGGSHEYEAVIPREAERLGRLASEQLMLAAEADKKRRR